MALATPKKAPEVVPIELQLVHKVFGQRLVTAGYRTPTVTPTSTTYDDLLCGVELEIERLPEGHGFYSEAAGEFWSVEEDGSLRPRGQSWEFISAPAKLSQALAETRYLFQTLQLDEERNYSDRCSVHIHTNVQDWTQQQVAGLAMIYPVFEGVLFQFVNHYKKREEQGYCRDTNLYCIPWSDCRHNRNFVENLFTSPGSVRNWQKYTALNFLPIMEKGTVEWRHMHGTCDMEKLTIWFNVIGAIMKYCASTPFDTIVETIQRMNDVSTYQQFFEEVLMRQLPYNDDYRRLMAEGVVNAKYSLINWEVNKGKPKKPIKTLIDWALDEVRDDERAIVEEDDGRRIRERVQNNLAAAGAGVADNGAVMAAQAAINPVNLAPPPGGWVANINPEVMLHDWIFENPPPEPAPNNLGARLRTARQLQEDARERAGLNARRQPVNPIPRVRR